LTTRKLAAGALAFFSSLALVLGIFAPANAATKPTVVYALNNSSGWHHPQTKPSTGSVMQGTLKMTRMSGWSWGGNKAVTKRAVIHEGSYSTSGKVTLFNRKSHNGRSYFAKMNVHENNCHNGRCAPTTYCLQFTAENGSTVRQWNEIPGGCPATATRPAALSTARRTPAFTAAGHSGCHWSARGKHEFITYAYLRMTKDTCPRWKVRIRIAGKCSVAGWRTGNWIDKKNQLTSISCPFGQGYFTIGYDYQWYWPKDPVARHHHKRGKVHFVTLQ
jgi:hypothetical protein